MKILQRHDFLDILIRTIKTPDVKVLISFKEFVSYFEHTDIQKAFDEYSMQGGMAGSYLYDTTEEKYNYIKEVFETLIIRDIFSQIFLLMMHEISVLKNLTLCKNCKPVNFFLSAKKFD